MFLPYNNVNTDINNLEKIDFSENINIKNGKYVDINGSIKNLNGFSITDKIKVVQNATYKLDMVTANGEFAVIAFYDKDDAFISCVKRSEFNSNIIKYEFTVPSECEYVRFTVNPSNPIKLEVDTIGFLKNIVEISLSNDTNINNLEKIDFGKNINIENNKYINLNGSITSLNGFSITDKIKVVQNARYKLNMVTLNGDFGVIGFYDKDDAFISCVGRSEFNSNIIKYEFTVPSECEYVRFTVDPLNPIKLEVDTIEFLKNIGITSFSNDTDIIVPSYIDVVTNHQVSLYRDCMVTKEELSNFVSFNAWDLINKYSTVLKENCLQFTPTTTGDVGLDIRLMSKDTGKIMNSKHTTIRCFEKNTTNTNIEKNIMICGDSLVDSNVPSEEVFRLLRADGDYIFNDIGTRGTEGGKHEGRGSWKWETYLTQQEAFGSTNAFLYNGALNFKQYCIDNSFAGIDYAIISLGTNDAGQGWQILTDEEIATIIQNAKTFLNALLDSTTGFPDCKIALGLPAIGAEQWTNPCMNKKWFISSMQKLNKAYIETFDNGKFHPNVTTVAHGLWTDREYSYRYENQAISDRISETRYVCLDAIHPSDKGYKLWADAYYAKIRAFLNGSL